MSGYSMQPGSKRATPRVLKTCQLNVKRVRVKWLTRNLKQVKAMKREVYVKRILSKQV